MKKGILIALLAMFLISMTSVSAVDMFLQWDDNTSNFRQYEQGNELVFFHAAGTAETGHQIQTTVTLVEGGDFSNPVETFYDDIDDQTYATVQEFYDTDSLNLGTYSIYGITTDLDNGVQQARTLNFEIIPNDGVNDAPFFDGMQTLYVYNINERQNASVVNPTLYGDDDDLGDKDKLSYSAHFEETDTSIADCNRDFNGVIFCKFLSVGNTTFNVSVFDGEIRTHETITIIIQDTSVVNEPPFFDGLNQNQEHDIADGSFSIDLSAVANDPDTPLSSLRYGIDTDNTDVNVVSCGIDNAVSGIVTCNIVAEGETTFLVSVFDGEFTVYATVLVEITDDSNGGGDNSAPVWNLPGSFAFNTSDSIGIISLPTYASDVDGDTLTFTADVNTCSNGNELDNCVLNDANDLVFDIVEEGEILFGVTVSDNIAIPIDGVIRVVVTDDSDDNDTGDDNLPPVVTPPQTLFTFDENDGAQTIIDLTQYSVDPDGDDNDLFYFGTYTNTNTAVANCDDNNRGEYECVIGQPGDTSFVAGVSDGQNITNVVFTIVVNDLGGGNDDRPMFTDTLPVGVNADLTDGSLQIDLRSHVDFPNLVLDYTIDQSGLDSNAIVCSENSGLVNCVFEEGTSGTLGVSLVDQLGVSDSAIIVLAVDSNTNTAPTINIPSQIVANLSQSPYTLDLSQFAFDVDFDNLTYRLNPTLLNPEYALCEVTNALLTCDLQSSGFFNLEVIVNDGVNGDVSDTALFIVSSNTVNQPPVFSGLETSLTYDIGDSTDTINLAGVVVDDNPSDLVYSVDVSNTNSSVAIVSVNGALLSVAPNGVGDTTFDVIVSDGEFTISAPITVTVNGGSGSDTPVAIIDGPTAVFLGDTVTFDGTQSTGAYNSAIVDYSWFIIESGSTASGPQLSATFTSVDNFTVILTVTDEFGLIDSVTQTVEIVTDPVAVIDAPSIVEEGEEFTFDGSNSVTSPLRTITSYDWRILDDSGNVVLAYTGVSSTYTAFDFGTYEIQLTITDSDGFSAFASQQIIVNEASTDGGANLDLFGQEDGLTVSTIDVQGFDFERAYVGDVLVVSTIIENDGRDDMGDVRMVYTIPELGYKWKSNSISLDKGDRDSLQITIFLPEDIEPGIYYPIVSLAGDDIRRSKPGYLEILEWE